MKMKKMLFETNETFRLLERQLVPYLILLLLKNQCV